ncbi:hypothetical protein AVEN_112017-1 [Araneus ventricosus]|uniref:Uncharacterized protein n=1 Tax=Araneus ventricosus TaxID=182803 RepID=A0A4Y2UH57_ARAVE|nr:hypothetical protein AVEN_112017-1 [Araneus ventricosus]
MCSRKENDIHYTSVDASVSTERDPLNLYHSKKFSTKNVEELFPQEECQDHQRVMELQIVVAPSCFQKSTSVSSATGVHFDISKSMRPPRRVAQELSLFTLVPFLVAPSCFQKSTSVSPATGVHFDISKSMRPPRRVAQELSLFTLVPFQVAPSCFQKSTSVSSATGVHFDISKSMRPPRREANYNWML